jgi:hypothetical protein
MKDISLAIFYKTYFFSQLLQKRLYIIKLYKMKSNFFFSGSDLNGRMFFWYTFKKLGFKKQLLKNYFLVELFFDFLVFQLQKFRMTFLILNLYGKNKFYKKLMYKLLKNNCKILQINGNVKKVFNGTKVAHKRRL